MAVTAKEVGLQDQATIHVQVRRSPGDRVDRFEVPLDQGMSVFNVLDRIRNEVDPTLVFLISCRIGKCDICLLKVNGKTRWSCTEPPSDDMLLEPLDRYGCLKDLAIDWDRKIPPKRDAVEASAEAGG